MNREQLLAERTERIEKAIRMEEPDRVPFLPGVCLYPFVHAGVDYKASFYDFPAAADAIIKYYEDYPMMDGINHIPLFMSYVSYELVPTRIALGISIVLACGQIGMFFAGYWITLSDMLIPQLFATDVERAFFCAAVVFIAIGVVSAFVDPRPKALWEKAGA